MEQQNQFNVDINDVYNPTPMSLLDVNSCPLNDDSSHGFTSVATTQSPDSTFQLNNPRRSRELEFEHASFDPLDYVWSKYVSTHI
jgi:hypothetical protein